MVHVVATPIQSKGEPGNEAQKRIMSRNRGMPPTFSEVVSASEWVPGGRGGVPMLPSSHTHTQNFFKTT